MIIYAFMDIWDALKEYGVRAVEWAIVAAVFYFAVSFLIYRRKLNTEHNLLRQVVKPTCLFVVLAVYFSYLTAITLSGREAGSRVGQVNLNVFSTFFVDGDVNLAAVENMLLFIPLGLLFPAIWRLFRRWWNLVLSAFIISMIIEITQLATARGFCEIDDVIINTFGAFLGYIIFVFLYYSKLRFEHRIRHGIVDTPTAKGEDAINKYTLFAIQLLPVLLLLLTIFGFSSDDGETSTGMSLFVSQRIVLMLDSTFHLGLSDMGVSLSVLAWEPLIRNVAHFVEYAMLAFFTFVFLYCRKLKWIVPFVASFVFCLITAIADEINQSHIPGRDGSAGDVLTDMFGVLTILVLLGINIGLRYMYNKFKEDPENE